MKRRPFVVRSILSAICFFLPGLRSRLLADPPLPDIAVVSKDVRFMAVDVIDYRESGGNGVGIGIRFSPLPYDNARRHASVSTHFAGLNLTDSATPEDVADGLVLLAAQIRSRCLMPADGPNWNGFEITGYSPERAPLPGPPRHNLALSPMREEEKAALLKTMKEMGFA